MRSQSLNLHLGRSMGASRRGAKAAGMQPLRWAVAFCPMLGTDGRPFFPTKCPQIIEFSSAALFAIFLLSAGAVRWRDASIVHKGRIEAPSLKTTAPLLMAGILPYIGGKNRLANQIIELFPPHRTYVEAFAGGASVFFRKERAPVEVLNDRYGDVVTVFRVCQLHHEELLRYMRFMVSSRAWFDLLRNTDPVSLTDIQRAARYIYLQKNAYAGLVRNQRYKTSIVQPSGFNVDSLPRIVEEAHERLARVQIENLPYEDVLKHYDSKETLFFLDPPYYGRKLYNFNFEHRDFETLASRLKPLEGRFILSLNDLPEVRKLFGRFKFREVDLHYTAQKEAGKRYKELLITNF